MSRILNQLLYLMLAAAAFFCIHHAYEESKERGIDAKINYGAYNDLTAMAIAISENRYGFHEGYVARPEVMDALAKHLTPDGAMAANEKHQALADSRDAIEAALQEAISLDPKNFMPFYGEPKEPFIVMVGEDTGLVNYYRLAFGLFGYHADSMFKLYFLLITGSTLIFLIGARGYIPAAAALVALLFGFLTLPYLNVFNYSAPSMYSNRQIGMLGLVATLHILLFLRLRHRYASVTPWLLLLLQLGLLVFTITVRSSTAWQWLLILAWLALPVIYAVFRFRKHRPYFAHLGRAGGPVIALLIVLLGFHHLADRSRREAHDDVYFTRCTMIHHLRWHSAYLALAHHPDWHKYAPAAAEGHIRGDDLAWWVARTHWKRKYGEERYSCKLFPAFLPLGIHDMIMRKEFFRFVGKHKRYTAELYLIYKPRDIYRNVMANLSVLPDWWLRYVQYGAVFMAFAGFISALTRRPFLRDALTASLALLLMSVAVHMPAMFAYASYMAETMMVLLAATAYLPAALVGITAYLIGKALRKAFFNTKPGLPVERS